MKSDEVYRAHILDALALIREYVGGLDKTSFVGDSLRRDAVVRQLMIVGEAARRLSAEFRARYPDIPWADIVGMRNRLVHDYINVDWDLVWDTVHYDVPFLQARLGREPDS
jgi:uncharacterized protein with HEPN domain